MTIILNFPLFSTPLQNNKRGSNLIELDDDPDVHRYLLNSYIRVNVLQAVQQILTPNPNCNAVIDEVSGDIHEYRHLIYTLVKKIWTQALATDLGRLAQGVGTQMKTGTSTIRLAP